VFKKWPEIFNNDSTLASALLDRLLHHAETVLIEGKSCRMKEQIEVLDPYLRRISIGILGN
jgi:DNA replication protein DnaC